VDASKIKAPLTGSLRHPRWLLQIEQVDQLEEKLKAAGVKYTFYRYDADTPLRATIRSSTRWA
jgi:hypothetical protein